MNRMTLIKIHLLLAAFMFPAALMFLVTGGLYTWGYKGSYVDESQTIVLTEPLVTDAAAVQALVEATGGGATAVTPAEAVIGADVVVLAIPWDAVESVVTSLGDLSGKIVIDPTNPRVIAADGLYDSPLATSNAAMVQAWAPDAYVEGNHRIAEAITPFVDDRWFQESVITDRMVSGGEVVFTQEDRALFETYTAVDNRVTVMDGKITRFEIGTLLEN